MSGLEHLPPDRREAIAAFLTETVGTCPYCGADITRSSPRALDGDERLTCLACVDVVEGDCVICRKAVSRREKRVAFRDGVGHWACVQEAGKKRG